MAIKTEAIGKEWPASTYQVGREKIKEYANALGIENPVHFDVEAARAAGFRDVVAPPMFCVVYALPAMAPAILDPEVGINFATMVHGGQDFEWGEPACSGDEITTTPKCTEIYEKDGKGFYVFESTSVNQDGAQVLRGDLDQHRQGGLRWRLNVGDQIPELRVTPDKYLPHRYAGASGDFNPIHIDAEFAKAVGLPSNILHGLYSMGLVARANAAGLAGGDPRALKRLSVQFRGMGLPEQEIVVSGTVKSVEGDRVVVDDRGRPGREPDHPQRRGRARALGVPARGASRGGRGTLRRIGGCSPSDRS